VPFTWTLRLAPAWFATVAMLLLIYFAWDTWAYSRESFANRRLDQTDVKPLRVDGKENLVLLGGIVAAAAFLDAPLRELAMVGLAAISLVRIPQRLRGANHFSFHPIIEVAVVFAGIFATMIPALELLHARGAELGVREPWQFFWATGALSSFLDNAPTYLTFLALAQGQGLPPEVVGVPHRILMAISLGAVFMGANTYIGNGPNFMVRSIAEARGVRMPTFGGYMLYSGAILLPVFGLVTRMFFQG
jgi:Na+/H+ antiporter NhaD/arsenite permease-like protein